MTSYQKLIREIAPFGPNPAAIEAWMRSEHGTLDHLAREMFANAAEEAAQIDGEFLRSLADSFGLGRDHAVWEVAEGR